MVRAAPPPVVLMTGFDAFGGETLNPSWLAVQALNGRRMLGHQVVAAQVPTVFGQSRTALAALLKQHKPSLVICVGQAGGRASLSLERVAINVDDARIPDNARAQPIDTPVVAGAPAAYFTRLPIKAMHAALLQAGIPADVSQTAGTFVCNHLFFSLMHLLATGRGMRRIRGGFIHVPWMPEQGKPSLTLDLMVEGLALAARTALRHEKDVALGAGATH